MIRPLLFIAALLVLLPAAYYLLSPPVSFPVPPPGAIQSVEPADTESPYRRAYYSNYTREEIMAYYRLVFPQPYLRLNHPPEMAAEFIRDQTRSSWLEELVQPWKNSLYINGFYPTKPTEQITIGSVSYKNKITVRLIPSQTYTRLTLLLGLIISAWLLVKTYVKT